MRSTCMVVLMAAVLVIAVAKFEPSGAQETKTDQAKAEPARARIVPMVLIRPGETKELFLSTRCTVGVTRSGGLDIREVGKVRPGFQSAKIWKRDGVTAEVPDFAEGKKLADSPPYALLREKNVDVFVVKLSADKDARPALYELHVADFTCNGDCDTDFRLLVAAPSVPNAVRP